MEPTKWDHIGVVAIDGPLCTIRIEGLEPGDPLDLEAVRKVARRYFGSASDQRLRLGFEGPWLTASGFEISVSCAGTWRSDPSGPGDWLTRSLPFEISVATYVQRQAELFRRRTARLVGRPDARPLSVTIEPAAEVLLPVGAQDGVLRRTERRAVGRQRLAVVLGAMVLFAVSLLAIFGGELAVLVVGIIYTLPFAFAWWAAHGTLTSVRHEIEEAKQRDELNELSDNAERQAQRLFNVHSLELARYYDQALRQRRWIFWVGVGCILAGFAIVGAALYLVADAADQGSNRQWTLGVLGLVSAVLANFVGAMFLRMFSGTGDSIAAFHQRFVATHHLHFANFLAAKISEPASRDDAFSAMASALAREAPVTNETVAERPSSSA